GERFADPVVAPCGGVDEPVTGEVLEGVARLVRVEPEMVLADGGRGARWLRPGRGELERRFEHGALQVLDRHLDVSRIDPSFLGGGLEQRPGIARQVLVERRARADEDGDAPRAATPRAAEALPRGRDRARVPGADHRIEVPDVDAEL